MRLPQTRSLVETLRAERCIHRLTVTRLVKRWRATPRPAWRRLHRPPAEALDGTGKRVLADALHTQTETAPQILYEGGGDDLLTVKGNQQELVTTLEGLLTQRSFSPSTHAADARQLAGM